MRRLLGLGGYGTPGGAASRRALSLFASTALIIAALAFAPAAFAGNEGGSADPLRVDCESCHGTDFGPDTGPHGDYAIVSQRCSTCHRVHNSTAGGIMLLPSSTIKGTCNTCHDGTGGQGVYGALAARSITPQGQHRIDTTWTIPGGNASSGLETTRSFSGVGHFLGCDDCHNPHDADTVNHFRGERFRGGLGLVMGYRYPDTGSTSKLLKRRPTGASVSVDEYGSDWCLGCHAGRMSGGAVYNHPVDSGAGDFHFNNVALLATSNLTSQTVMGAMTDGAGFKPTNRGYLMPDPRTAQQAGHAPICQQCHEDSRDVGELTVAGADATTLTVTPTDFVGQYPASDNPRFQNFPHETEERRLLVENDDDLCMNCHLTELIP